MQETENKKKTVPTPSVHVVEWKSVKSGDWCVQSVQTSEGAAKHQKLQLNYCETRIREATLVFKDLDTEDTDHGKNEGQK